MSAQGSSGLAERRGRSDYAGFRAVIKAVGTGPRGSRALTFDEARGATAGAARRRGQPGPGGRVSRRDADQGRDAGRARRHRAGAARRRALGRARSARPAGGPIVACAGAYDGITEAPHLSLAAAVLAAAAGARVVVHCGSHDRAQARHDARPTCSSRSAGRCAPSRPSRWRCSSAPTSRSSTPARRSPAGTRSPACATRSGCAARCTRPRSSSTTSARRASSSATPTAPTASGSSARSSAARRAAGGRRARDGGRRHPARRRGRRRPTRRVRWRSPSRPAASCAATPIRRSSAELTRAIAAGDEHGVAGQTALLSAGVRLYAAGRCDSVGAGAALAAAAVADGRAAATLEALLAS